MLEVPGLGRATACAVAAHHRPRPLRFVWHHVLPQTCGGLTEPANLEQLCDSCHYGVHALLWYAAQHAGAFPGRVGTPAQRAIATRGYTAAVTAGTVASIPDEGNNLDGTT